MALSMFRKKDQLVAPAAADDSAEKYEFLSPIQSKSKTRRIATLGATLTAVGALCSYALATNNAPEQIVTVTQDIPRGAVIQESQLGTMNVLNPPAQAVPYKKRSELVGKKATKDISSGQVLLSSNAALNLPSAEQGQEIVGLQLPSSNIPVRPLKAGDRVILIPTNTTSANKESANVEDAITGTVDTVTTVNGDTKIDVVVPQGTSKKAAFMDAVVQKKVAVLIEGAQ